jgi:Terminase large subunit, T4likevirus-type, N-terminal
MILPPPLPPIAWKPHPGSQVLFLACPVFECLYEGTRGPGKTDALLMSFVQFVGRGFGPEWRGILFRETYKQLADVVKKSKRWFRKFFPNARFLESHADFKWIFPGGEELLLRVGQKEDDYWDYHGHEYPWIGFEELTNWRDLAFFEMMQSCCRSSVPGMPRMVRATCNPYGRGHAAVKERYQLGRAGVPPGTIMRDGATGRERTYVHGDIRENTTLLASDPDYMATLEGTKDPNRRKAWLYGDWDIHIGAFLEGAWDPERHIVKPFSIPPHWKLWQAMDWGYAKPYAVGWFAKDPEGKTYLWRELYGIAKDERGRILANTGTKETPDKVAARIVARELHDARMGYTLGLRLTGPDLFAKGGAQYGAQNTHAQTFRRAGLNFRPWWAGPGSRKAGAMLVKQTLELDELAIFDTCEHTIRTVPAIEPDPDDPDDVDTEAEDHCFDMLKAGLMRRTSTPAEAVGSDSPDPATAGGAQVLEDGRHLVAR